MRVPSFISFIMLTCIFLCSCTKNQELNLDVTEIASLKLPENVRGVNEIINASQFRSCDMPTSTTFVGFFGADKANGVTVNIFASSDEAYSEFRMEFERDSFCLDKNN